MKMMQYLWAMREDALRVMMKNINDFSTEDRKMIERTTDGPAPGHQSTFKVVPGNPEGGAFTSQHMTSEGDVINDIAVINVHGIITRKSFGGFFGFLFGGGASTEDLRALIQKAVDNPMIKGIVLDFDTPGGDIDGTPELADFIHKVKDEKPIVAFVSTDASSAGFWLASATSAVVMHETAMVGSIGVLSTWFEGMSEGLIDIVSSVSPKKVIDVETPAGLAQMQAHVDTLGKLFVKAVAKFRDVTPSQVVRDFGQGDIKIGKHAVDAGMADHIGTVETAFEVMQHFTAITRPSTKMQTLIFSKDKFSKDQAQSWAKAHSFVAEKIDETEDSFRIRQRDPEDFRTRSLRTIEIEEGITAVVGKLKPESQEQSGTSAAREKTKMKAKIKAIIEKGLKAKLVVVDDEETDVEGMDVEEIDADWIRENLPAVAEELAGEGGDEEEARQDDLDSVETEDDEEAAQKKAHRKDRTKTAKDLSVVILAHRAKKKDKLIADRDADVQDADPGELVATTSVDDDAGLEMMKKAGIKAHGLKEALKA